MNILTLYLTNLFQYTYYLGTKIYVIFFGMILLYSILKKKSNMSIYFFIFLIFEDFPKFGNGDFNSVYFGIYKNMVFIYIYIFSILKCFLKKSITKRFFIYNVLFIIYIGISLFHGINLEYSMVSINVFLSIFILPESLKQIITKEESKKILKYFDKYIMILPLLGVILLGLKKYYEINGYKYIFFGPFKLICMAYLIGSILEKKTTKKLINLFIYMFIFFLAPSSGEIIVLCFLLIISIVILGRKISFLRKFLLFISSIFLGIIATIYVKKIYLTLKSGSFLKLKLKQIFALNDINNVERLPYSLQVRIIEIINIFKRINLENILFSNGVGSYYYDNYYKFKEFDDSSFSKFEIENRVFYNAHFIISMIFLKFGLVGLVIFIEYTLKIIKNYKLRYIYMWIVIFYSCYWGIKGIIIWIFIYGSLMKLKEENKG